MVFDSPDDFLAHVLRTFRPYLKTFVLVGGFAVRLYELHPRAAPSSVRVLRTFDADLAVPNVRIPVTGESLAALAESAGFQPDFRGDHIPPVMKFVPKRTVAKRVGADEYTVEFLTPLTGARVRRGGKAAATSEIQEGVTAQRLRYLDLLLESPWPISLAEFPGGEKERGAIQVLLPHPGFLIVQKILISDEPNRQDKRPKDMAYIYQVVSLFRRHLPDLAAEVRARMGPVPAWRQWLARFKRMAGSLFAGPRAPAVTEAHAILGAEMAGLRQGVPSVEMIHAGVNVFLEQF